MLRGIYFEKSSKTNTNGHPFVWHADTVTRHKLFAVHFGVDNEKFVQRGIVVVGNIPTSVSRLHDVGEGR
jgi:hypothetical protein